MTQPHAVWPAAGPTVSALTVSGSAVKPPPNSQLMSSPSRATMRRPVLPGQRYATRPPKHLSLGEPTERCGPSSSVACKCVRTARC